MIRRRIGALLVASSLALGGCQSVAAPSEDTAPSAVTTTQQEGGDGAPGDLLPTGDDRETGSAEPAEPTENEPTEDQGEQPELGAPGIPACEVDDLPATALNTIEDIEAGGPYEFPRNDGVRFQNREGILPDEAADYYREFTVVTPNLDHRGARRIVTGGGEESDPDRWFYTGDHYESFCEFEPDLLDAG